MKLFTFFSILIAIPFFFTPSTNAQNFVWAKQANVDVIGTVLDKNGNGYIGGDFGEIATFDTTTLLGTCSSVGGSNIFLAKYNSSGKFVQAFQNSGTGDVALLRMCNDKSGHIYLIGQYEGSLTLGTIPTTGPTSIYSYFVAKLDTAFNVYWVKTFENHAAGYLIRLSNLPCDNNDSLYIYGQNYGSYTLDGIPINSTTGKLFFAKLNPISNSAIWARQIQANYLCVAMPNDIITDVNNDVIVGGTFGDNLYATPGDFCVFNTTDTFFTDSGKVRNAFIAKYDQNGNYLWATQIDSFSYNDCQALTVDPNRNIFVIGSQYFAKYNASGAWKWLHNFPTYPIALATNKFGNYIYDDYGSLCKYDTASGSLLWNIGPLGPSGFSCLAASNNGTILLAGDNSSMNLGANHLFAGGNGFGFISLLKDSAFVPLANNTVKGNIFNDTNSTCLKNLKPGLNGFGIIALPGPYYTTTDSLGNYSLKVDTGTYSLREIIPSSHAFIDSQRCPLTTFSVAFSSSNQIDTGHNFPNQYTPCSSINISSSIPGYGCLACQSLITTELLICNYGSDTAYNPVLTVHYPDSGIIFHPLYSSIPWYSYISSDSLVTFVLSSLPPDSCIAISITDSIICTSPYYSGTNYYYKYRVTPINSCYPTDSIYNSTNVLTQFCRPADDAVSLNKSEIEIYPNPTDGRIIVKGLENVNSIEMYNVFGLKVFSQRDVIQRQVTVDFSNQPTGIYFLIVVDQNGTISKKIIKQ